MKNNERLGIKLSRDSVLGLREVRRLYLGSSDIPVPDSYVIEVAYKANMVKTSYHDIRNMVEMAKLINHPHKQAFPALEYLWEADVFKLP